jgi:hypothetical protein
MFRDIILTAREALAATPEHQTGGKSDDLREWREMVVFTMARGAVAGKFKTRGGIVRLAWH